MIVVFFLSLFLGRVSSEDREDRLFPLDDSVLFGHPGLMSYGAVVHSGQLNLQKLAEAEKLAEGRSMPADLMTAVTWKLAQWVDQPWAPPLTEHPAPPSVDVDCASPKWADVLTGERRPEPVRIVQFVPINTEVDLLEIRLHELDGLVDRTVVMEGVRTHRGIRKPLFFSRNLERFAPRWSEHLVHFVADDHDQYMYGETQARGDDWRIETQMRWLPLAKYLDTFGLQDLDNNTLLWHGDADEIPSRELTAHLKYCVVRKYPVAVTTDWYQYSLQWRHQYQLERRSRFFTMEQARIPSRSTPGHPHLCSRIRECGDAIETPLHSGVHLSYFFGSLMDLPFKTLSLAEGGVLRNADLDEWGILHSMYWLKDGSFWGNVQAHPARDTPELYVPWFARSFPERYPWFWATASFLERFVATLKLAPPVFREAHFHPFVHYATLYSAEQYEAFRELADEANATFLNPQWLAQMNPQWLAQKTPEPSTSGEQEQQTKSPAALFPEQNKRGDS